MLLWLASIASIASAQSGGERLLPARPLPFELIQLVSEPNAIMLTEQQIGDLEQWVRDFDEWQEWTDRWLNRRQWGFWSVLERKQKPDPPVWLEDICQFLSDDRQFVRGCELLTSWRDDTITAKSRHASAARQKQQEAPTKSVWWQRVHIDGLWSTTQSNAMVFGLVGAHLTFEVEGRLQVFAAPGIMLTSVPSLYGTRDLMPATDWGMTFRLFNAGRGTVHFNLVHAWILGNQINPLSSNMTLAGFSVTMRPRPR